MYTVAYPFPVSSNSNETGIEETDEIFNKTICQYLNKTNELFQEYG